MLFIHCLLLALLVWRLMLAPYLWCVLVILAIILLRYRELVAVLELCCSCPAEFSIFFLTVPRDVLWSVIVAFPGHTHLLFNIYTYYLVQFHKERCYTKVERRV